jgi:MFS family permease
LPTAANFALLQIIPTLPFIMTEVVMAPSAAVSEAKPAEQSAAEKEHEPGLLILFMLCAVSFLEGADTQLLPASMFALQKDINLALTDLAVLNTAQAVMTNLAAPFWGTLADRGMLKRRTILVVGSLGQGMVTILLAVVTSMGPMILLRGLCGVFLASLRPISNGIVADMTSDGRRGKIFSRVQSALLLGMFVTTLVAGNMANKHIAGIQGWRVAFVLVGLMSGIVSCGVAFFMQEPSREEPLESASSTGLGAVIAEIRSVVRFFTIPTFGVMVMQGIFGTIPWTVMGNMVLYFKLTGMQDMEASVLSSTVTVTGVFGNLIGGLVADSLARRLGYHGRPLSAQITVLVGIPIIWLMFWGVPAGEGSFALYFTLIAGFGLLGSWAQSGTNFPILSDIVPAQDRSKIMAWECALEHSIANAIGPVFVSILAEKTFGYTFGAEEANGKSVASATALGKAMTCTICIPWIVTFLAYTLLHWSYPRDMRRLLAQRFSKCSSWDQMGRDGTTAGDATSA